MTQTGNEIIIILIWGFAATAALSGVMFAAQRLGYSRLSLPFLIGTMFTGERSSANAAGLLVYLMGGWLFAFVYYFVFASIGRTGWWLGALLGAAHGFVLLVMALPLLPHLHPRMASEYEGPGGDRTLQPPGFLALNYGYRTPLTTILAHAVYGAILGAQLAVT
ncbi:MAG TPA: hypothetical protein VFE23_14640 [Usitatibacter sp.]|jgi:uncharacterized membrane protein YagU involved in acid resistance|nr:hypothetical protein [Usitatibacter sp.]